MKTEDSKSLREESQQKSRARRKLLFGAAVAAGGAAVLPASWTKPVVDTVLLPAHAQTTDTLQTNCEIAQSTGVHTTLVQLLTDTGLAGAVCGADEITVWAPTDAAFAAIADIIPTLTDQQVKDILVYHTASGTQPATPYPATENTAPNVGPSVLASNGVVHVIDQVLVPPGTL